MAKTRIGDLIPKQFIGKSVCEPWTDKTKICVKGNTYGFTAELKPTSGGPGLPISFGKDQPRTLLTAMAAAKKFVTRVISKNN